MFPGRASEENTKSGSGAFASRRRSLYSGGPSVSTIGFGSYRIGLHPKLGFPTCEKALESALKKGMNLVDTSTNYGDGQSEILVGRVLKRLVENDTLKRENVVVVSKVGYVQGTNLQIVDKKRLEGHPFLDVFEFGQELSYCIHPTFIADQIERSRSRLGLETVDVYLLHNVEYILKYLEHKGESLDKAREIFYEKIRESFIYLESLVAENKIAVYGISSNTFGYPDESPESVSVEKCLSIANEISPNHNFKVVQTPLNWIEMSAAFWPQGEKQKTFLETSSEAGLGVLVNRPLNAIYNEGLIRLARPSFDETQIQNMSEEERRGFLNWSQLASDLERMAHEKITLPGYEYAPLSQLALASLVWLKGVTSVLCGARRPEYVADVEEALSLPAMHNAKQTLQQIYENLEFHKEAQH